MDHLNEFLLNEYLDGVLDEAARKRVEAHLHRCPRCRARLDDLRSVFHALGLPGEKPLGRDLVPGILARLPRRTLGLGWRVALAIQAGAALGLLVTFLRLLAGLPRPEADLTPVQAAWADFLGWFSTVQWPSVQVPRVELSLIDLPALSLPIPAPAAIIALLVVVILWGLGNARLLGIRPEVRS